ncbi:unnamed protein product [Cuscuta epithymum]|uniref:Uncharacterized protein n=1 Tax=Cuscuta epithymum TaxID=186058 RepID=A0AAV0C8U6_9ASTE|nr:unnamed protein product [Cuscuta epithymum]
MLLYVVSCCFLLYCVVFFCLTVNYIAMKAIQIDSTTKVIKERAPKVEFVKKHKVKYGIIVLLGKKRSMDRFPVLVFLFTPHVNVYILKIQFSGTLFINVIS